MAGGEIDQVALDAADIAQPQHRAAADGAALRLERPAGGGGERHDEAAAIAAQRVDGVLHALRRRGLQPGAEGEHALGHVARDNDCRVAKNVRPIVAAAQATSTCGSDNSSALSRSISALQRHGLVARGAFRALGARAHQHDGRQRGEANEAEGEGEAGDVLPADAADGIECRGHAGAGRRGERDV